MAMSWPVFVVSTFSSGVKLIDFFFLSLSLCLTNCLTFEFMF